MNPKLFNIYVIDLEEELEKKQKRDVVIGREKTWSILYANDSFNSNKGAKTKGDDEKIQKIRRKERIGIEYRQIQSDGV